MFDNGVRLNIEMQDHQEPVMDLIPLSDMKAWLKQKMEREKKKKESTEHESENNVRKSQQAAEDAINIIDGASLDGSVIDG